MTIYLAVIHEGAKPRHMNLVIGAPSEDEARKLMRMACPTRGTCSAVSINSKEAQDILGAATHQLGYPLIYRPKRRVTLVLDVDSGLTDNDIREKFSHAQVISIEDVK